MNQGAKKQLIQAGVFTGTLLLFFLTLALFAVLGRKSWERGLRAAVEQVLPPSEWQCGKMLKIDSSFSSSAACFELVKKNEPTKKCQALIMRASSYWGPFPAVFVVRDGKAEFMGAAYTNNSVSRALEDAKNDSQSLYWAKIAGEVAQSASLAARQAAEGVKK